jgi:indolepyruvate decarboxylase
MQSGTTISEYLIRQLYDHGVRHIFGIPGDYSLSFLDVLQRGPIKFMNTSDEQGAGFAAEGYARVAGLGAVSVTYAVGSLKVANATAQAYVERSPVVVICGSPGLQERARHPLLHHRVNSFDTQLDIFRQLTAAATTLHDPQTACAEIDRVLHAAERHKRPVYIELPRDMVPVACEPGHAHRDEPEVSDEGALAEALAETAEMLARAKQPVIVAGVELMRFGQHEPVVRFAERHGIPIATTLQSKSAVREDQQLFIGLYAGAVGPEETRRYVESSDCQLLLGAQLTDMELGMFTAQYDRDRTILANSAGVAIRHHSYDVRMPHFLAGLPEIAPNGRGNPELPELFVPEPFRPHHDQPISVSRLIACLNGALTPDMLVVADVGDSLFGALDLRIPAAGGFLSGVYYSNMGFAVPAGVGAQIANPRLRPLVIVGDGAFQMTGMELSIAAHYALSPIVIVLNNDGYMTERFFLEGPFNDIQPWAFSRLPEVIGAGLGFDVRTEDDLSRALAIAKDNVNSFSILDVHIQPGDVSDRLRKLGESMGKTVRG